MGGSSVQLEFSELLGNFWWWTNNYTKYSCARLSYSFLFYWFFSIRKMRKGLMGMGKQKECNAIHARNVVLVSRNLLTWNNTCWVICLRYFRIIVGHLSFSTEFFFKSTFIVVFFLLHGKIHLLMSCFIILHQEKNFQYLVSGILFILFVSIKDQ